MAVISVIITESDEQIVAGIPKTIALSTNVASSIFYTLDGNDPTLFSTIYTGIIYMPKDKLSVTIKVMASNGVDTSPIISETYVTNMLQNARLSHSSTNAAAESSLPSLFPFGDNSPQPTTIFLNPGDSGITVDNPALSEIPSGFDGDGYDTGFTNYPYNTENYNIIYSTKNAEGETGPNIGNLPANVTFIDPPEPSETSQQFTSTFDPRAFVIFQDFSKENPDDPPQINRQFFSLEDPEKVRDGNSFFTAGLDSPPLSGSFLRSHYNQRTNTLTHYYRDSWTNKWIISSSPYTPSGSFDGNLAKIALSNRPGAGFVFEWIPFARRVLF